jgi:hypothetical protein
VYANVSATVFDGNQTGVTVDGPFDLTANATHDLELHPRRLRGHIVDAAGRSIDASMHLFLWSSRSGSFVDLRTDEHGHFDALSFPSGDPWILYDGDTRKIVIGSLNDDAASIDATASTTLVPLALTLAPAPGTELDCRRCLRTDDSPFTLTCFDESCEASTWALEGQRTTFRLDEDGAPPLIDVVPRAPRGEVLIHAGTPIGAAPRPAPVASRSIRVDGVSIAGHRLEEVFPWNWLHDVEIASEAGVVRFFARPIASVASQELVVEVPRGPLTVSVVVHSGGQTATAPSEFARLGPSIITP